MNSYDIKFKVKNATYYIPNLFVCGREKLETFKKNEVKTGKVIDLTHEGHGVVKVDRYPIFILML